MKILIATDKFKGTFSSKEINKMISKALKENDNTIETEEMQVSDGGDGLVEAIRFRNNFSRWEFLSYSANKERKVQSKYLYNIYSRTAIVESALSIGISKLRRDEKNPLVTSSYGLGYDISRVMEVRKNVKTVIVGIGGTATNDLFFGGAEVFGYQFVDKDGNKVEPIPENFMKIDKIIKPEHLDLPEILVATDVTNPLCGENGASKVFGPQKGATNEQTDFLDKALLHGAKLIKRDLGFDILDIKGAGAGGGIGGGMIAFLGGKIIQGADFVLDTQLFDEEAMKADVIITGEGSFDRQSLQGKITGNIIKRAQKLNKPVVVICGKADQNLNIENCKIVSLFTEDIDLQEAKKLTEERINSKVYWAVNSCL